MPIVAGGASRVINCAVGDPLEGQLVRRRCESILDDLEANAFYVSDGTASVLFVSCDLLELTRDFIREAGAAVEHKVGISARNILVSCTHTHTGPSSGTLRVDEPMPPAYREKLKGWLADLAWEAVAGARPARVGWGLGHAHIGFNRRTCWRDGTHLMYGKPREPAFTGLEGPDDPSHAVLFARDEAGELVGVLHNNCCHATCIEMETAVSADFPGQARAAVRGDLGRKLPVLYLQGASGDVSPWDLFRGKGGDPPGRARDIGNLLAEETLRLVRGAEAHDAPVLRTGFELFRVGVRLPDPAVLEEARQTVASGEDDDWNYVLRSSIVRLQEEFGGNPVEELPLHVVRIGDLGIGTNPCELYCQFGLDIKRRSPAKVTMVGELTNGSSGYCPTTYALLGGGYSADLNYWTRLEAAAGYRLVDATSRLLHELWKGGG